MKQISELEAAMAFQMHAAKLPQPTREYRFAPPRRWRFDFAWPDRRVALEIEGGEWVWGRHNRQLRQDCEKYNAAVVHGWWVIRATGDMVRDGSALTAIERIIQPRIEDRRERPRSRRPQGALIMLLFTVQWSGTKEHDGEAPGLSSYQGESQLMDAIRSPRYELVEPKPDAAPLTPQQIEAAQLLRAQHFGLGRIAKALHCSIWQVRTACRKAQS